MGVGSTTVGVTVKEEKKKPPSPTLSQSVQRRRSWWDCPRSGYFFWDPTNSTPGGVGVGGSPTFAYWIWHDIYMQQSL